MKTAGDRQTVCEQELLLLSCVSWALAQISCLLCKGEMILNTNSGLSAVSLAWRFTVANCGNSMLVNSCIMVCIVSCWSVASLVIMRKHCKSLVTACKHILVIYGFFSVMAISAECISLCCIIVDWVILFGNVAHLSGLRLSQHTRPCAAMSMHYLVNYQFTTTLVEMLTVLLMQQLAGTNVSRQWLSSSELMSVKCEWRCKIHSTSWLHADDNVQVEYPW